jgi:hypothetical protein
MTRAVRSLVIVESDPAHPLLELLVTQRPADTVELAAVESSVEDWQREARRLELQGKAEQAEQIRREILDAQPVPWPVADGASLPEIRRRALGAGSRDKAAQQHLFEYALTYDTRGSSPSWRRPASGARRSPSRGWPTSNRRTTRSTATAARTSSGPRSARTGSTSGTRSTRRRSWWPPGSGAPRWWPTS